MSGASFEMTGIDVVEADDGWGEMWRVGANGDGVTAA